MRKATTPIITILIIVAVVGLALYALGAFDGTGVSQIAETQYASGEFTYSGGVKDGLFSGYGRLTLKDGIVYDGNFYEGRFSGSGVVESSNLVSQESWRYFGTFQDGRTNSGAFLGGDYEVVFSRSEAGVTISDPKWQYDGDISERGQNGIGVFTYNDGSTYTGSFFNGLADGEGEFIDEEGRLVYSGSFRDGKFDGQGIYYSLEGWFYEGLFKDGSFDGEGRITDGDKVVSGIWEQGVQVSRHE